MSSGGPDLFVICKNCGSEVSPYITECPYCGNRLRKRAPKLDRHGRVAEREPRRIPSPTLTRLRRGEIPGIRGESHPYATILLIAAGLAGCLLWRTGAVTLHDVAVFGGLKIRWWRVFTATFTYDNTGYAFVTLTAIAVYGTLVERRHGALAVLVLFLLGGVGGTALSAQISKHLVFMGANGAALALLTAWAIPDLRAFAKRRDYEGDLLGTAVFACVIALMPLAAPEASWISAGVGVLAGLVVGYPLARFRPY
jgi:membrane associated rhomboid family serine protease